MNQGVFLKSRITFRGFSPSVAPEGLTHAERLARASAQSQELLANYARMGLTVPAEGVTYGQLAQGMLSEKEAGQALPGRLKRFFTQLLDVNQDGRVSETEWTRFFYGVAQWVNDKNPFVPKPQENSPTKPLSLDWSLYLGRALSDCDYLVEEARAAGLSAKDIKALEARLSTRRMGGTGQTLSASFDVAKKQTAMEPFIAKMVKLVQNYDQLIQLPWVQSLAAPELKQFKAFLLRQLARIGNMPAWVAQADPVVLQLQQYDTNPLASKNKRVERYELKHRNIRLKRTDSPDGSSRIKLWAGPFKRLTVLSAIHPDQYHLPPQVVQANATPPAQALNQTLSSLKNLLVKTLLAQPEALSELQKTLLTVPLDVNQLEEGLIPLFESIKSALALDPLDFSVAASFEDHNGERLVEGAGFYNPASKPVSIVLNGEAIGLQMTRILGNPKANAPIQCLSALLEILLEELVHAHQHQQQQRPEDASLLKYPPERLQDYGEALRFHRLFLGMEKTVLGDKRYYTEQPMERDAKWVVQAALTEIIPAIIPVFPGPGPQEPAPQTP